MRLAYGGGAPNAFLTVALLAWRLSAMSNSWSEMSKPSFRYTHYDLKEQRAGTSIEITLSAVANVRLLNAANFERFTEALKHQFVGGVAKKSPIRLAIPEAGHWHLVVDMEGHSGLAESSVKMVEKLASPRIQRAS